MVEGRHESGDELAAKYTSEYLGGEEKCGRDRIQRV
jgi:hypothetical protein